MEEQSSEPVNTLLYVPLTRNPVPLRTRAGQQRAAEPLPASVVGWDHGRPAAYDPECRAEVLSVGASGLAAEFHSFSSLFTFGTRWDTTPCFAKEDFRAWTPS